MYNELYDKILQNLKENIEKSLSGVYLETAISVHSHASDFEKWIECLSNRYEVSTYVSSLEELNNAIYFLLTGQYRQSFFFITILFGAGDVWCVFINK